MSSARYIVGDALTVLCGMPDGSVDLVLSSPPFLALRSYLPSDHPDKALEIGSEPTPGDYLDTLLDIVEECRRVLAPHGSICIELGDTYAGSGGAGGDYNGGGLRDGQDRFNGAAATARAHADKIRTRADVAGWALDKSLCLIPESFRWALVYGHNPFNGRPTPRWRARNVVRWCRPNPPVGALADKVRPATSDMVIACVSRQRYFDLDAVRAEPSPNTHARTAKGVASVPRSGKSAERDGNWSSLPELAQTAGAPPLDHWWHDDTFDQDAWLISTEPYPGSHYATWPKDLLVKPITAMCPERVCTVCGKPSERITEASYRDNKGRPHDRQQWSSGISDGKGAHSSKPDGGIVRQVLTNGWTDCGHDAWRPGVVLDPFAGSGTTLEVATGHSRDCIGIDLDERNAWLARDRVGMFLTIEEHVSPQAVIRDWDRTDAREHEEVEVGEHL